MPPPAGFELLEKPGFIEAALHRGEPALWLPPETWSPSRSLAGSSTVTGGPSKGSTMLSTRSEATAAADDGGARASVLGPIKQPGFKSKSKVRLIARASIDSEDDDKNRLYGPRGSFRHISPRPSPRGSLDEPIGRAERSSQSFSEVQP